jgi:hypothetical protein
MQKKSKPPLKEYLHFSCEFFFYCEFSKIQLLKKILFQRFTQTCNGIIVTDN